MGVSQDWGVLLATEWEIKGQSLYGIEVDVCSEVALLLESM